MSIGLVRALSPGRLFTGRTAFLAFTLLLSTFALPPLLGLDSPLVPAGAVVNQGDATGCQAYGTNWTSCQNAFASDDLYAYANESAVSSIIQRVATTTDAADASSWSFSHTTPSGSNRLLLLAVATDNGEAVSGTPQYGSTSFALITTLVHSSGKPRVTLYGLIAPTFGAALVTGNVVSSDKYTVGAASYTGVHQTMPGDNLTTAEGASGTTMIINVPSEVGDLVVDFTANTGNGAPNVGTGQTEIYNEEMGGSASSDHFATSSEEAGASSVQMRWNGKESGKEWVSIGLNLNSAPPTLDAGERDTAWRGFGFSLDPADEVQVVEVGVEWWRNNTAPILNVTVSWDSGTTWATNQTATNKSVDDDAVEWLDFTFATAWNASKLRDANLRVRVGTNVSGARLDYVTVRTTYNDAPEVSNLRLEDAAGQSFAGGLLDPTRAYHFLFAVTDEDGWIDIGTDGAVGLQMWYDGNVTPELSFAEQTNGSDYRVELRYEDLADPGNATLDEWSVVEGSATYNASASSLTALLNGTTLIGYEFNLSVSLGLFVKAASEPTNSTPGAFNDPDSWNVEALAFDGSVGERQPRAAGGEHMEFGVFALALMGYSAAASPTTLQPGDTTVFQVDFENTGQGPASRVWVNVTFPAELTYVSDDAATLGGARTCCESFEFTDVDPGSYVFNVTASANGGVANGTVAVTNLTYQALDAKGRPINQTAEDVSVTIVNAVMAYAVSASPTTLQPGDTTVFRVDFTNAGQGDAGFVWVNVTLPSELTYVSDDAALMGGTVLCCYGYTLTNVAPGIYSFNITATANGGVANGTVATTNFTFEAADPMGAPLQESAESESITIHSADMSLTIVVDPTSIGPGALTAFEITFSNSGLVNASVVWVNVTLPAELLYVSDDAALIGGVLSGTYSFEFTDVMPGDYTFNLTVAAVGGMPNGTVVLTRFVMEGTDLAGAPLIGESQDVAVTLANAVLILAVTASSSLAEPGDALTFTATVTNSGAAPAESLAIEGSVDANATYVSSLPGGTYDGPSRLVRWTLASLAAGTLVTFQWTVTVNTNAPDGATVTARATVESQDTSGTPLPSLEDSNQVDMFSASFVPVLVMTPLVAERGDEVLASLYYNNTGAGPSGAVWINWTFNGHYELVALIPQPLFTTTADGFDVVLPSVASGTQRLDARLRVIRGLQDNLTMGIDLSFVSSYRNGNPLVATDLQASAILQAPAVALSLATRSSAVDAGTAFTLDMTITNTGQAAAMGWLNLTLPAGVAFRGDDGTYPVTETADGVSWVLASIPAGATISLVVTLTADSDLGLQSFRFAMAFTDGKGSPPVSAISNAVSLQIGPGASTPPLPWLWLLLAALVVGIVLFALTRRRRTSIEEVFVVHQTGVLIAHRSKTLTPDKDEDILAAMLSTVQNFIQDAFSEHEDNPVRGLQFDKFNILVEQGTHHYVAVVFRGRDNGTLQARLHQLSQQIEEEFGETLATWAGMSSDVRPVKGLLPLLWGKRKARERRGRPKAAAVPEEPPEIPTVQPEAEAVTTEITGSAVRKARKAELRAWCLQQGLDDSGNVADLRKRLLHDLETREGESPSETEAESGLPAEPAEEDAEVGFDESSEGSPQDDVDEAQAEEQPLEEAREERQADPTQVAGEGGAEPEVEPAAEAIGEIPGPLRELTVKQIWDAPKPKLREWCRMLGLDDTGPIMNMRLRLLSRIEPT